MKYDFETFVDRSRDGSSKWSEMMEKTGGAKPGVVPMSTADMEFMIAPEIRKGLKAHIDAVIPGYTIPTQAYYDAVLGWQERRHGYHGKKEWIVTSSGVVPAIFMLVHALTEPGDGVILQQPVYYPFSLAAKITGRRLVNNPLIEKEATYEIDYEDLEAKARDPRNKVLIFCNPHNPIGKVWAREELERVVDICRRNHVFIIDDEIHNDLIMPGYHHTSLPSLSPEASRICAYCTAPSKTFNLAGYQISNIFIEDDTVRHKVELLKLMQMNRTQVSISYEACRLAYTRGEPWLEELLPVIAGNARWMEQFFAEKLPQVRCYPLQGTYLPWVDFRGLGLDHLELAQLMEDADLYLDDGSMFGRSGRGFQRFDVALPRPLLQKALERLVKAWEALQEDWQLHGRPRHVTLSAGMDMPDFTYDTPSASGLRFRAETAGKPTVLLFLRYASCSICQDAMEKLRREYFRITRAGGQVMVVLQSTPESVAAMQTGREPFPFAILCDPQRSLYRLFNVFPADSLYDLPGDALQEVMPAVVEMMASGGKGAEGNQAQLPAWFAIGGDGRVLSAHYCESLLEIPDAAAMAAALS